MITGNLPLLGYCPRTAVLLLIRPFRFASSLPPLTCSGGMHITNPTAASKLVAHSSPDSDD